MPNITTAVTNLDADFVQRFALGDNNWPLHKSSFTACEFKCSKNKRLYFQLFNCIVIFAGELDQSHQLMFIAKSISNESISPFLGRNYISILLEAHHLHPIRISFLANACKVLSLHHDKQSMNRIK